MIAFENYMRDADAKIRQLQHQCETWKREIEFWMQENAILKNRLAEIVSASDITSEFLEKAEQYQTSFISNDELIRLIRNEMAGLDRLFVKQHYIDGKAVEEKINTTQKKISAETEAFSKEFTRLKFDFNNYMNEYYRLK